MALHRIDHTIIKFNDDLLPNMNRQYRPKKGLSQDNYTFKLLTTEKGMQRFDLIGCITKQGIVLSEKIRYDLLSVNELKYWKQVALSKMAAGTFLQFIFGI